MNVGERSVYCDTTAFIEVDSISLQVCMKHFTVFRLSDAGILVIILTDNDCLRLAV